jgi:hypothetical protein
MQNYFKSLEICYNAIRPVYIEISKQLDHESLIAFRDFALLLSADVPNLNQSISQSLLLEWF